MRSLEIECPRFLGGTRHIEAMPVQTLSAPRVLGATVDGGLLLSNCPEPLNRLAIQGSWHVHVLYDDIVFLGDAYSDLEYQSSLPVFEHHFNVYYGAIILCARCSNMNVEIAVQIQIGLELEVLSIKMTLADYLNDWRMFAADINSELQKRGCRKI